VTRNSSTKPDRLAQGGMNFGEAWKERFGECKKETAKQIFEEFVQGACRFFFSACEFHVLFCDSGW
jgi:hypothetical protein